MKRLFALMLALCLLLCACGSKPAETTAPPETTEPAPPYDTSPNVLSIDFDALIQSADKDAVKEVHPT